MVRTGAETFLAAQRNPAGIEQVAEEFPAGGCLVTVNTQLPGNAVGSHAGWHGAGDTRDTITITR